MYSTCILYFHWALATNGGTLLASKTYLSVAKAYAPGQRLERMMAMAYCGMRRDDSLGVHGGRPSISASSLSGVSRGGPTSGSGSSGSSLQTRCNPIDKYLGAVFSMRALMMIDHVSNLSSSSSSSSNSSSPLSEFGFHQVQRPCGSMCPT